MHKGSVIRFDIPNDSDIEPQRANDWPSLLKEGTGRRCIVTIVSGAMLYSFDTDNYALGT